MDIHAFLTPPAETARRKGPYDRIVMSSRVRLARNLKEASFPGWAKKPERVRVLELIRPAVQALPDMKDAFSEAMDNLSTLDKQILVERHLISREHAAKSAGSGLVLNREETLCVMINEEDHLRMQALRPGLQLRQPWGAIVERLEKVLGQIIEHEENARGTLLEKKPKMVYNHIGRAYGILANAHSISSKETMNLLSLMRLGVDMGLFPGVDRSLVDELFILTQPAHLQKKHSEKLSAEERDLLRADMVRERLRQVSRPIAKPPATPPTALDKPQK